VNLAVQVAAALGCVGVAFGINLVARPQFDPRYDAAEYAQNAGTLTLSWRGSSLEVPLMPTHVVTADVERFGRGYAVRELTLRAAGSGEPHLQLFATLSRASGELSHDPSGLLQLELPLAKRGRLGAQRSYIVLEGRTQSEIVTGSLMLTDVTQIAGGPSPQYRAEGRLEMQVQTQKGVDMVTGKWNGTLVWDATAAAATGGT
jgi:hypothetical protein